MATAVRSNRFRFMVKVKHIPIRTCVACRATEGKRGLLRVVRTADGAVAFDPTGKAPGRGAYVCGKSGCIALARKQKKFERSLKVTGIAESLYESLQARVEPEAADSLAAAGQSSGAKENAEADDSAEAAAHGTATGIGSSGQAEPGDRRGRGAGPQESEE
jgi:uncharacterized protein